MKEEYKNDKFLVAMDAAGADVDGALNRFMGKVSLYKKFMKKFLEDRSYPDMLESLAGHDPEEAFRQAHTLKGVAGNLGINNLLAVLVPHGGGAARRQRTLRRTGECLQGGVREDCGYYRARLERMTRCGAAKAAPHFWMQ